MRQKLFLSSAALLGALTGYGRGGYAGECTPQNVSDPDIVCTGVANPALDTEQTLGDGTGFVGARTVELFGIDTSVAGGNAISIDSNGGATFVDTYASTEITGTQDGLQVANDGGAVNIVVTGDVTGTDNNGISASNSSNSTYLTLTTNAGSEVRGGNQGIRADHDGDGSLTINVSGYVYGGTLEGINADNSSNGTDLSVTTNVGSEVIGTTEGIEVDNSSVGSTTVSIYGNVTGGFEGIEIDNQAISTNMSVTTGAASEVRGNFEGINADHDGPGSLIVDVSGYVYGATREGIVANNSYNGSYLSVTTGTGSDVSGATEGIDVDNNGDGFLTIDVSGNVTGTETVSDGIVANNSDSGTYLSVTTAAGTTVSGNRYGILASNAGSRPLSVTVSGDVEGGNGNGVDDSYDAIGARSEGSAIDITVGAESTVTTTALGADSFAVDSGGGATTLAVAGTLNGGEGGAVQFDEDAFADRLELHTTAIINGNVFAGDGTDTLAFAGTGGGAFNLDNIDSGGGTQQYQGFELFQVESGIWNFSGATSEAFSVDGGTLTGNGTFGGLTVNGGATIAPGDSIGTIIVNGPFALNAGAIFEAEVNAAGENDQVIVNGTVNLTGATLQVLAENGNYDPSTDYTIIDNDGNDAVAGEFGTVTSNFVFLDPSVDYEGGDGNDVVLTLTRNATLFQDVAQTKNQTSVAGALDQFPTDNPLFLTVLNQTATGARQAFDALSGEIHASVAGTLADDSRYTREAVLGRLMQASHAGEDPLAANGPEVAALYSGKSLAPLPPGRAPLAFWTQGFGAWADFDSDGNAASASRDLGGFLSGIDADIGGGWRAGVATGASFSNVEVNARASAADVETYHLGGYLGGMVGGFALRGGGLYAWNSIDTSRAVVFPGFFERQNASYDADTGQLFGEIAYPTQMRGIAVEPFGGIALVSLDTDTFRERGGPLASLRGVDADQDVGYTTLGLRAATTMQWGGTQVTPHISAAWQHAFDDVTPGASLAFATTGIGFAVDGVPLAEDAALLDAGLDFALGENGTAGVSYSGQFGEGVTDNAAKGRITWLF
ncbi:MAG: autotransporter domain-containing protein [Methyloceanibacter sp.]|nr:autotransporter domain-containing protein [Methyloceanibacter sp.]